MTETVKTSDPVAKVFRSFWMALDAGDSEEDEEKLARRRQLCNDLSQSLGTRQLLFSFHSGQPLLVLRPPPDVVNFLRPRWPVESEVITDVIQHIDWEPPDPEPFYCPSGQEEAPIPVGDKQGNVVYCADLGNYGFGLSYDTLK